MGNWEDVNNRDLVGLYKRSIQETRSGRLKNASLHNELKQEVQKREYNNDL